MADSIKFTEEETNSINELRQEVGSIFTRLGQLSITRARQTQELDNAQSQLIEAHQALAVKEQELFQGLNEKYGDGNYDPKTGTFIPTSKEETAEVQE